MKILFLYFVFTLFYEMIVLLFPFLGKSILKLTSYIFFWLSAWCYWANWKLDKSFYLNFSWIPLSFSLFKCSLQFLHAWIIFLRVLRFDRDSFIVAAAKLRV